jgi:hypothetical protein
MKNSTIRAWNADACIPVNKEWTKVEAKKGKASAPPARSQHSAVYSRAHDRMVVFGGQGDKGTVHADLWSFDFSTDSLHPRADF